MGYAIALMGVALLAVLAVLVGIVAAHTAKGVGILETILRLLAGDEPLPVTPHKPWDRQAIVASAQRARRQVPSAKGVAAMTGAIDGIGDWGKAPPSARRNWRRCSPDGSHIEDEATLYSAQYESGYHIPVDGDGRPVVSPMAAAVDVGVFRRAPTMPALGEDEEETRHERQSGFWTRRDG